MEKTTFLFMVFVFFSIHQKKKKQKKNDITCGCGSVAWRVKVWYDPGVSLCFNWIQFNLSFKKSPSGLIQFIYRIPIKKFNNTKSIPTYFFILFNNIKSIPTYFILNFDETNTRMNVLVTGATGFLGGKLFPSNDELNIYFIILKEN